MKFKKLLLLTSLSLIISLCVFSQQEILRKIDIPILILQGGKDLSASPEKTTEMVNILKQEGKSNIDYYFYPEYDHSLNFFKDEEASEKVINDMQKWIHEKLDND